MEKALLTMFSPLLVPVNIRWQEHILAHVVLLPLWYLSDNSFHEKVWPFREDVFDVYFPNNL